MKKPQEHKTRSCGFPVSTPDWLNFCYRSSPPPFFGVEELSLEFSSFELELLRE
jgi:hypothetical protein